MCWIDWEGEASVCQRKWGANRHYTGHDSIRAHSKVSKSAQNHIEWRWPLREQQGWIEQCTKGLHIHERRAGVSTCGRGCGVGLEPMQNTCVVDRKRVELWEIHQCRKVLTHTVKGHTHTCYWTTTSLCRQLCTHTLSMSAVIRHRAMCQHKQLYKEW